MMTGIQVQGRNKRALFGWSPPDLPADTVAKRRADRLLPRTGAAALLCYAVVVGLLSLAPHLPERGNLAVDGLAALLGAAWCGLNFWRCRHAHCVVTSTGWAVLSVLAFTGACLGRSLIGGYEQPVFLAVLAAGVLFEAVWYLLRGSNSVGCGGRARSQEVTGERAPYPEFSSSSAGPSPASPDLDRPPR
jgi:hypothetical protein